MTESWSVFTQKHTHVHWIYYTTLWNTPPPPYKSKTAKLLHLQCSCFLTVLGLINNRHHNVVLSLFQSEEDKQLQEDLEMMVERLSVSIQKILTSCLWSQFTILTTKNVFSSHFQEKNTELYRQALEELRRQIRSSTTSMTSVPKPLKFLRPHYGKLKEIYEGMAPGENKVRLLN